MLTFKLERPATRPTRQAKESMVCAILVTGNEPLGRYIFCLGRTDRQSPAYQLIFHPHRSSRTTNHPKVQDGIMFLGNAWFFWDEVWSGRHHDML